MGVGPPPDNCPSRLGHVATAAIRQERNFQMPSLQVVLRRRSTAALMRPWRRVLPAGGLLRIGRQENFTGGLCITRILKKYEYQYPHTLSGSNNRAALLRNAEQFRLPQKVYNQEKK